MKQKCKNCEYEWEYKGESEYYATCPRCLNKVKIKGETTAEQKAMKRKSK